MNQKLFGSKTSIGRAIGNENFYSFNVFSQKKKKTTGVKNKRKLGKDRLLF